MDHVASQLQGEVAADGAGPGCRGIGRAHRAAHGLNGIGAFQHAHDNWARRDELDQSFEERFALVLAIVPIGQRLVDANELEANKLQATALQAGNDFAGQAALHGVGFDDD